MNQRLLAVAVTTFTISSLLAGCATSPRASIIAGEARVIDGTLSVDFLKVKALVAFKDDRAGISAYISDCRQGNGTLWIESSTYTEPFRNVVASAPTAPDQLFSRLCSEGLPRALRDEQMRERRRAAMTPEERETERSALLLLLKLQQAQQAESARNASRERAAQTAADALKESKKSTTECKETSSTSIRCETK